MPTALPLAAIRLDDACQPRAVTDLNLAGKYAEAMLHGAQFPPVVVFGETAGEYWLADGYHRFHATEIAGRPTIAADVRPGGRREAILHSVGANADHGWRRSTEDKQRAVQTLLNDPEWAQWSDREIGRRCGVHNETVAARRRVTDGNRQSDPQRPATRTYVDKHGNTSTMNTAGIGRRREPDPDAEYTIPDDPRQTDIEDVAPRFVYDADAAKFCGQLCSVIETLNAMNWPDPSNAGVAWMKERGVGPSIDEVQFAADWMAHFAELYRIFEPQRLEAVEAMLQRAKELTNGTH
jgi:hypothetical protein